MSEPTATREKGYYRRSFRIRIEKRLETPAWWNAVTPVISITLALLFNVFLKLLYSRLQYTNNVQESFGTRHYY